MSEDFSPSKTRIKLMSDFESFKQIPFPDPPESDLLDGLWTELAELDGHVAGLVSSFLNDSSIDSNLLGADRNLGLRLNSYLAQSEQEQIQLSEYRQYKAHLDSLLDCVRKSLRD